MAAKISSDLPEFVNYNGMQSFPGPYYFRDVQANAFFVKADFEKLKAVCETMFGEPSDGEASYVPLSDMLMFSFIEITDAGSIQRPKVSAENERELAIWIMLGKREKPGSDRIVSIAGFNPFLVVNNPLAVIDGRTIYGYEKQYGLVTFPDEDGDGSEKFIVKAWGGENLDVEWEYRPVVTLTPKGPKRGPGRVWNDVKGLIHLLKDGVGGLNFDIHPTWSLAKDIAHDIWTETLPQVFLKQFRDIHDPTRAVYQAITEAPVKFSNVKGITIDRPFEMRIDDLYNTAIAETLGLERVNQIDFGLSFTMDFTLENGREVWRA